MPYSVLAGSLPPEKTGVYMGIFNFFIVIPEILASLFFGWIMNHWLHNNRSMAVAFGGVFLLIAAVLMRRVYDPAAVQLDSSDVERTLLEPASTK
jgi:maltose/moltooligosaccharide transporter